MDKTGFEVYWGSGLQLQRHFVLMKCQKLRRSLRIDISQVEFEKPLSGNLKVAMFSGTGKDLLQSLFVSLEPQTIQIKPRK